MKPRFNIRKLDAAIRKSGLSQRELSARAGVHYVTTSNTLNAVRANPETIRKLAGVVGLSLTDLVMRPAGVADSASNRQERARKATKPSHTKTGHPAKVGRRGMAVPAELAQEFLKLHRRLDEIVGRLDEVTSQ